jgi:phosphoribosylamine-glycine ligase
MKALVLAGGYPQIALVKDLKKRGYTVLLADWGENPPARQYADKFYQESTLDIEAIETIARAENVDLLITVCTDQALHTVATLSERLNLPCYVSSQLGRDVTNKRYMKSVLQKANIPTAKHMLCKAGEKLPTDFVFPMVVKPVDANSSKGVVKVHSLTELQEAVVAAQKISRTDDAIIEEFVQGRELTIDAFVQNGKATLLCISEIQKIPSETNFVICRTILPPILSAVVENKIKQVIQQIADAFSLKNCPLLVQLLNRDDDIYVVEFSARTGGGEKYKSIKAYTGVDIIGATVDVSLGIQPEIQPQRSEKKYLTEFLYCHEGTIDAYLGFEEAQKAGWVDNYELFKKSGDEIHNASSSSDRAAAVMFVADSYEQLMMNYQKTMALLQIRNIHGNDIMRHDIIIH